VPASGVPFGDPFLLRIGPSETVGEVKRRIQDKLGVAVAEFESWKVAFVSSRGSPQYLEGELGRDAGRWGPGCCLAEQEQGAGEPDGHGLVVGACMSTSAAHALRATV
jgi:hypothetical protein